jgi:penicillin amidase
LANDPHLGHSVPQIWYPLRLFKDKKDWVVGVSIPGIPGVVIGMNPYFSWGLTNIGEDVESFVVEEIDWDTNKYVQRVEAGEKVWQALRAETYVVKVKGGTQEQKEFYYTSRGPVEENPYQKGQFLSRQWLPLFPGIARIPTLMINRATDWKSFNTAINSFMIPGQNVIYLDRKGNIGYRASGRALERKGSSQFLESFETGSIEKVSDASERRRKVLPFRPGERQFLSVANQRIWIDDHRHKWAPDDRAIRISEYIESVPKPTFSNMAQLHIDTVSKYHSLFRNFIIENSESKAREHGYYQKWIEWSGDAAEDKLVFTQMDYMIRLMENILLLRIKDAFAGEIDLPEYKHYLKRAWIVRLLEQPEKFSIFGFSPNELSSHLIEKLRARESSEPLPLYDEVNRWKSQHPFVGRIPLLGELFRISEPKQLGFDQLVRVEDETFGASMRVIFDMKNPAKSSWTFPVGQSGHVHSPFYTNFRERFLNHDYTPLIPEDLQDKFF